MIAHDLLVMADALVDGIPDDVALVAPTEFVGEFEALRGGGHNLVSRGACGGLNVDPAFARFAINAPHLVRAMRDALRQLAEEQ